MGLNKAGKTLGPGSAGGSVTVGNITDASELGKDILLTVSVEDLLALISALGTTGDQTLDGKLQINHQLVLKSIQQTDANVLVFQFGDDDGVIDAAIKATATTDNKGQMALCVRDDSGNLINVITLDGNSKAVMVQPGYAFYVGNNTVDISGITPFAKKLLECQDAAAVKTLLGITG